MKRFYLFMIVLLLVAGCKKREGFAPVRIHVNDFTISQEDFPSKNEPAGNYERVKAITLAFYATDGTEVYKTTQLKAESSTYTTFGNFECSLPIGSYTMVVIGYYSDIAITLNSPTSAEYTNDKCRETFVATQTVNVPTTAALNLSATLQRVVTKLRVSSTDNRVAEATKVNVTFSAGGKSFNPSTGLAISNSGLTNNFPSINATTSETAFFDSFLFLATDEQTMDITIDVLNDADEVLYHKVVNNVPFKRNRATVLSGKLFSSSSSASFTVDTDWLDDTNIDI